MKSIVVSGYISLDRIIMVKTPLINGHTSLVSNDDNQEIFYGGCPINIASALNRYHVSTVPLIRVGVDFEETNTKQYFQERNIPLDGVVGIEDATTSNCYLIEDTKGQHHTVFYPGAMDDQYFQPYNETLFQNADIAIMTVGPKKDNEYLLEQVKKYNLELVFGAKLDYDAFPIEFLKKVFNQAGIIFLNEYEASVIRELFSLPSVRDLFRVSTSIHTIIVTYGDKGSSLFYKNEHGIIEDKIGILQTDHCVDTTGSGDAYIAGFMYGYVNDYSRKEACKLGAILASYIVQAKGCNTNTPTLEELMKTYKDKGETL